MFCITIKIISQPAKLVTNRPDRHLVRPSLIRRCSLPFSSQTQLLVLRCPNRLTAADLFLPVNPPSPGPKNTLTSQVTAP